ncbi:hypothetical protein B9K06_17465 [Bacillus sp. OG2]|nr:hypothetical protein B9K06_17465 [Bacillus sp. OG2]
MISVGARHRRWTDWVKVSMGGAWHFFCVLNTVLLPITEGAEGLADITNQLLERSNQAAKEVDNADEVLSIIKKIADQTNLLGLAGDKGFGVVANEIRKLSHETISSTEKIYYSKVAPGSKLNVAISFPLIPAFRKL